MLEITAHLVERDRNGVVGLFSMESPMRISAPLSRSESSSRLVIFTENTLWVTRRSSRHQGLMLFLVWVQEPSSHTALGFPSMALEAAPNSYIDDWLAFPPSARVADVNLRPVEPEGAAVSSVDDDDGGDDVGLQQVHSPPGVGLFIRSRTMIHNSILPLLLLLGTCSAYTYQNLALRGKATQSGRYESAYGAASSAIDGNRDSDLNSGSCTHTNERDYPWWRVDLLDSYIVTSVIVTNRGDCCHERLDGAEIHISDTLIVKGNVNPAAGVIPHIPAGRSLKLTFTRHVEGRYVIVVLPGSNRVLSLCEVEVYGYRAPTGKDKDRKPKASRDGSRTMIHNSVLPLLLLLGTCSAYTYQNVALRGKATHFDRYMYAYEWEPPKLESDPHPFASAWSAIDGNRNSDLSRGSCAHTIEVTTNPWWTVELLHSYIVTSVIITSRGDCCADMLHGAEIHIGDSYKDYGVTNPLAGMIPHIPEGTSLTINFTRHVEGRYVTVLLPGSEKALTLCEVEVYGYRSPTGENLALGGQATQSSLPFVFSNASNAIDGNRAAGVKQASCTQTKSEMNPWWRLDLGRTHRVFSINITNNLDSLPQRLNGAEIRIGDSLLNNGNDNPRCAVISSIPGGFTADFQCGGMDGRYVNVVIPGRIEHLMLCEVEVYGSRLD
ncbi:Fucolectin [Liparis tanakae]|uniref:Fucolectin n=1 Tax=Liparis tanakae TaxID=230148 RepID=A0A4Z2GTD6_9TELE|nr:Fucolectin [Liparis tanakae]